MKICKVCGEPNASESRFCINCGSESFEVSDVKQKICPECGSVCEPQFTHCVNCRRGFGRRKRERRRFHSERRNCFAGFRKYRRNGGLPLLRRGNFASYGFLRGLRTRRDRNEQTQGCQAQNMPFLRQAQQAGGQILQVFAFST